MSQNRSHAVMQQRFEAKESLDDFPTPPWAGRALCEHVLGLNGTADLTCWEPACNRGHLVDGLKGYFAGVYCSDITSYGWSGQHSDFDFVLCETDRRADWIITNPPFNLAEQFVERAVRRAKCGVAMLVRSAFLEGVGRYERLFRSMPPNIIAQFVERVPMVKGRYDPTASTATSYAWLVWIIGGSGTRFTWIPPCRKRLERSDDARALL